MEPYERSGLIVPVVLWGRKSPQIRVSHVCSIRNGQVVVTGTTDGHVVQWTVDEALGWVQPDVVLIAHDTAISCVAPASDAGSSTRYVTCSEDGQICLWDSVDGRAVDSTQHQYIHRRIVPYRYRMSSHHFQIRLLCVGDYAEILVVDGHDLNVLFSLSSRVEPDWINTLTVVHADRSDVVIGVSRSSMIKLWSLADLDKKDASTIIYEDESKMLNARNVRSISCSKLNTRMMLVVSPTSWQVVDPSTLNQLVVSECAIEAISGVVVDVDRIAVGFADATVVLFQLPRSKLCGKQVTDRFGEHPTNIGNVDQPFVFALLKGFPLPATMPALNTANFFFEYRAVDKRGRFWAYRTDHQGNVSVWHVPKNYDVLVEEFIRSRRPVAYEPNIRQSFAGFWDRLSPKPPSVYNEDERTVTATVFVGSQGKLLLGRDDGTIVMMYACHAIAAQLLESSSSEPVHQRVLSGHSMAVTCFLYPFEESNRYDPQLLLSGGNDFAVIVWNLTTGTKVFRFCCQGGPIQRLLVPPDNCNPRVLHTICSVAGDNSVALLSLKENKCVLLASRQQYPVVDVRWRPLDDFMLVRCEDDTVYVWQMETANLDRIVAGVLADDVMEACKEQIGVVDGDDEAGASQAIQVFRALRHRNVAAIKRIAAPTDGKSSGMSATSKLSLPSPMDIVQLKKCSDQAHLILFNIDALITGLLCMDYEMTAPSAHSEVPNDHKPSLSSLISKRGEHHASRNHLPHSGHASSQKSSSGVSTVQRWQAETNLYVETARLLVSLLHGWNLDEGLDSICLNKLRLQRPKLPICYGAISRRGHLSLYMPYSTGKSPALDDVSYRHFSRNVRWQLNRTLTTVHVLSIVSLANTLMSLRSRSLHSSAHRPSLRRISSTKSSDSGSDGESQQVKQGWSNVAALHCAMLPDLVKPPSSYASPKLELLARRWQDACVEIRDASQALLIRELSRLGSNGRRQLIKTYAPFLPTLLDPSLSILGPRSPLGMQNGPSTAMPNGSAHGQQAANATNNAAPPPSVPTRPPPPVPPRQPGAAQLPRVEAAVVQQQNSIDQIPSTDENEECSGLNQVRRNQATALILLGVLGAEFPQDIQDNVDVGRAVSHSLLELITLPDNSLVPMASPLRRAAIDLVGRGFTVWQPHLDMSKVLLSLLDLASTCDSNSTSGEAFGAPLSAMSDACKTARHALSLIASTRPQALITALSMEVARFNSAAQHQTIQHAVVSPLLKSRNEVLRLIEQLSEKQYNEVADLIIPVGDILVHCLDTGLLKQRTLAEVFPPVAKFYMVGYCPTTRRIAFGGKTGAVVVHELRALKAQTIQAHKTAITALAFSQDGKYLAVYSSQDAKISFWQTQQTFLGMGQSQIRCVKTVPAPSEFPVLSPGGSYQAFRARLVWINAKSLTLMLPNGKENRFTV